MDTSNWYPALPADGDIEFPTLGRYSLRIRMRYDGHYECDVWDEDNDAIAASWILTPDENICICLRKTAAQADADEDAFVDKLTRIIGVE